METKNTMTAREGESLARRTAKDSIEQYIDKTSLEVVLALIGEIASEKAQHIAENWQDQALAKAWDKAAIVCFSAAMHNAVTELP